MNWQNFNTQLFAEIVGWTLIHSLWQISLIAFLLVFSLRILKNASANVRYLFSGAALFSTVVILAATFIFLAPNRETGKPLDSARISASIQENLLKNIDGKQKAVEASTDTANTETIPENQMPEIEVSLKSRAESLFAEILPSFIWFWLGGVLLFSLRFCGGIWQVSRLKKRKINNIGDVWQTKFDNLCDQTGVRRTVKFLQSELVKTPMVVGWIKPIVIVPSSVLLGLNPRELETIIAHELIHIRRHDYLVNILQSFVEIILFFHPLAWWISAQLRRERENACDDEVLKIFAGERLLYANALANLEDFRSRINNLTAPNGVAANGGNLIMRIQRIIKKGTEKNHQRQSFWAIVPVLLVISAVLTTAFLIHGQAVVNGENSKTNANKKKLAIGLYSGYTQLDVERSAADESESMRRLVEKLKELKIPITGFAQISALSIDNEADIAKQEKILNLWRDAKFEIGFRDYKSPQSYNSSLIDYLKATKRLRAKFEPGLFGKDQQKVSEEMKKYREEMRKFKDDKKIGEEAKANFDRIQKDIRNQMDQFEAAEKNWKKENNLTAVKYSIGAYDWIYSATYDYARRKNDKTAMTRIKTEFINYMSKIFDHYEQSSQQLYGRNIPQTIPLTPSRLTADSANELFAVIKQRGYEFISMDEAMQDEAYQSDRIFVNSVGKSWLDPSVTETRGGLPDKPKVDEDVMAIWYK